MTADDLYQYIKIALDLFNLSWSDKYKITMHFSEAAIVFKHGDLEFVIRRPNGEIG